MAEIYQKDKETNPARIYIEIPTFLSLMSSFENEDVIDFACGTGFYTREIRKRTTGKVVGVDISEDMIQFAKNQYPSNDIDYHVHDCSLPLDIDHKFDIVSATYLFQYAKNKQMLMQFLKTCHDVLKPGGQMLVLNLRMDLPDAYSKYVGNDLTSEDSLKKFIDFSMPRWPQEEGDQFVISVQVGSERMSLTTFHLHQQTYDDAIKESGFGEVKYQPLLVSEDAPEEMKETLKAMIPNLTVFKTQKIE